MSVKALERSNAYVVADFFFTKDSYDNSLDKGVLSEQIRLVSRKSSFPFLVPASGKKSTLRKMKDGSLYLAYPGEGGYWIQPQKNRIEYRLKKNVSDDFLWDTVEGPLTSYLMALKGKPVLHGSAVCVQKKAIGFLAPSGKGKSTLAASFALRGFPLITDDLFYLTEKKKQMLIWPGARGIRLWPKSVTRLLGKGAKLPGVVPGADKKKWTAEALPGGMLKNPVPLAHLFILKRARSCKKPQITELGPLEKWEALTKHLLIIFPEDKTFLAAVLKRLSTFSKMIPISTLTVPDRLGALDETVDTVLAHCL